MPKFGSLIAELRNKEGVGIKTLAPRIGITYTYLSKLENDRATPSVEIIHKVARYFKYDEDSLMLAAGRIPPETMEILQRNPQEAIAFLKERFGGERRPSPRDSQADRGAV
jgi:HTH-type transcriptional regulator, competence development regulator